VIKQSILYGIVYATTILGATVKSRAYYLKLLVWWWFY